MIDTSAWIEFFRKKDPYYKVILELIDNRRVCCVGIVLVRYSLLDIEDEQLAVSIEKEVGVYMS